MFCVLQALPQHKSVEDLKAFGATHRWTGELVWTCDLYQHLGWASKVLEVRVVTVVVSDSVRVAVALVAVCVQGSVQTSHPSTAATRPSTHCNYHCLAVLKLTPVPKKTSLRNSHRGRWSQCARCCCQSPGTNHFCWGLKFWFRWRQKCSATVLSR